jgi:hypothetical protein
LDERRRWRTHAKVGIFLRPDIPIHVARQAANTRHCAIADEEATTIKVASAKKHPVLKEKSVNGPIKLKKPAPKFNKAGNWQEGSIVQGE